MVENKIFSKLRMFSGQICVNRKSNWNRAWNLAFPVFILTYCMEYVWKSSSRIGIFQRATQRPRILLTDNIQMGGGGGAAVVSTITSDNFMAITFHALVLRLERTKPVCYFWINVLFSVSVPRVLVNTLDCALELRTRKIVNVSR